MIPNVDSPQWPKIAAPLLALVRSPMTVDEVYAAARKVKISRGLACECLAWLSLNNKLVYKEGLWMPQ